MDKQSVMQELEALGNVAYAQLMQRNHGVSRPIFGVKIGDMKKIQKKIKKDYQLALDLYATGNYDAMYFAGLIADDEKMTKKDLQSWAKQANGGSLAEYTVAWVAAGSPHGWEMALKWIEDADTDIARCGWATLSGIVAIKADSELDLPMLKKLVGRVEQSIPVSPGSLSYTMNNFLISVGCYVAPLTRLCRETGKRIGKLTVDLGPNNCKIPYAPEYIDKVEQRGSLGKKRKTVKC